MLRARGGSGAPRERAPSSCSGPAAASEPRGGSGCPWVSLLNPEVPVPLAVSPCPGAPPAPPLSLGSPGPSAVPRAAASSPRYLRAGKEPPHAVSAARRVSVPVPVPVLVPSSPWRSAGRSGALRAAWPSRRPPGPRGRCPRARARPSRCRCPRCPRPGSARGPAGPARSGRGWARGAPGGPRSNTASSRMCPTCARWSGGCSASSATSTRESCRRSGRSAPSSSWSTCGRCRRSWHGCTSGWTCAWRSSPRSRRRRRLTGTWTSCWHTWKSSAVPYRSCTWPRARTPRTRGPDPGPVPATPGSPARAGPGPCPRHGGGGRGLMTSAGGAGAMAAAPGPRAGAEAEAEGRRRLLRSVTRLQACARGFLLRRRLRSVREEFEAVVLEIEGDLRQLRWSGRVLQRPRFGPEDAPGPVPAGFGAPGAARPAQPSPRKPSEPGEAAENKKRKNQEKPNPGGAERGGSCGNIPPPNPKNAKPPPKPPDLGCGAAENKTIPRKTREKLNPGGAERGGNIPPSAPLPRGTTPNPKNPKTTPKPPDLGCGAAESPEEEEEGALEWDSDSSELGASPGIPEELQGQPPQG
ncbi:serine/arginine repetitive matrix protein 1 isoform X2 [Molothrus ater]|uniref:serine/arginine repetitive matrix protein 1 isoform X2 n=1 Tax=Molothrus ater TaxID=84834 RepID=UPI0023E8BA50|nr:serine/arginine repetitive matrix protein 1 isoform X2 [Molothrus ater]